VRVMVRDGLFRDGEPPTLLGSRCGACGSVLFPRSETCPYCASSDPEPVDLSRRGSLWAWTAVTAPPPGYKGDVPFGVGIVELPEGVRVITRLTEHDPGTLSEGQPMQLAIVPLHHDGDGNDVVTYAFGPVSP
jgi:uncharacterized protein